MGLIRHPGLQPLSRQHRDLLVRAQALRHAAQGIGPQPNTAAKEFLAFWGQIGENHFRYEENQLLASYGRACDVQSDEAVKIMLAQHSQLRRLIQRLAAPHVEPEYLKRLVGELGQRLDEHIRHEERIVFAQMQERMTDTQLSDLPTLPTPPGSTCLSPQADEALLE
jgi:hypothetical protein